MSHFFHGQRGRNTEHIIRSLLLDIIRPLCKVWLGSSVEMHQLKKYLFLFMSEAYLHLLKWTTFPMNAAQELLYRQLVEKTKERGETLPKAIWHYWTEVLSMMEHSTAVGYTGSMKIVPRQLGSMMWFGYAVHAGLLPCFNR